MAIAHTSDQGLIADIYQLRTGHFHLSTLKRKNEWLNQIIAKMQEEQEAHIQDI